MKLIEALSLLQKVKPTDPAFAVDLVCGFTAQPLLTFLAAHLQSRLPGRRVEPREGRFGDLTGNLERYLQQAGGAAAVVVEWADLDSRLGWRQHGGWGRSRVADICAVAEHQLHIVQRLLAGASGSGILAVAFPSVPPAPVEPAPGWQYGELQSRLDALAASCAADLSSLPHIRLVNPSRLAALSPPHRRLDVKTLNQAGYPYSLPHTDALAGLLAKLLQPPAPRKGIITDLDDTLWAGILGEVGVDGVVWDLEHHAAQHGVYQQMLQSLAESGVLVAVASKNDPELVRSALQRPDLLVRSDSIFPVEAHWRPKSESVARILRAWNIAADSVLFLDDSPMELAEVRIAHPKLDCRLFSGNDPSQVAALVSELADLFGKPFDSAEDSLRLQSLRAGAELSSEIGASESLERVLAEANGVVTIVPLRDPPDPRALELVNKTNQFNLNGRRFNDGEWLRDLRGQNRLAWMASYTDRFGSLGKISVLTGRLLGDGELELDAWVLSCRAFARRIEYALLNALFERHALRRIHFRFEPTPRNGPLQELLNGLLGAAPAGAVALNAADFKQQKLPWYLNVEWPDG
jgi:FkbH-like protein